LQFVQSLKYLGVFLVSAKHFKCTVDHIKVKNSTGSLTAYTLGVRLHTQNLWP